MQRESVEYYRARARDECEAALSASCDAARHSHGEMAKAYQRLAELRDLERRGKLDPGKVTSMSGRVRHRERTE
ncbi:MAG: hypothetical protein ACJ8FO_02750 [Sphingomicrobium sp.]